MSVQSGESTISIHGDEELLILAPREPHPVFTQFVRDFVDEGVYFPYGDNGALPEALPAKLDNFRCLMLDSARMADYPSERLRAFERDGGLLYCPNLGLPAGGGLGDISTRSYTCRAINAAGLKTQHPRMLQKLHQQDENRLVATWRDALPNELGQYERMGNFFSDPVGYICFRVADETAEFFADDSCREPMRAYIDAHHSQFGNTNTETTGGRYLLHRYEETGAPAILHAVLTDARRPKHWRLNGVYLNQDLKAPAGCDVDMPPQKVIENAWTWPEAAAVKGDTYPYLTKVTGEPVWRDAACTHVLRAHQWLFDRKRQIWLHVGRPDGPDLRSAPWGRGNAWFLYAIRGLLEDLPVDAPERVDLKAILRAGLDGLLPLQDPQGLWHNVLDAVHDGSSRPCASVTSRFLHVFARAYWKGWLRDERIPPMVEKAWLGLKTKIWQDELISYCVGTSHGLRRQVYLGRPQHTFRPSRSELLLNWVELQRMRSAVGS